MDLGGDEDSIMQGRTPSEAVKGLSGCHPEQGEGSAQSLFPLRVEPAIRKCIDNSWLMSSLCGLPGVIYQPNGKLLLASDGVEKPGAGERVRKNAKIVGTNPRSPLESIKVAKNEPKTNPKLSRKKCN
jgi:hypothetical protein